MTERYEGSIEVTTPQPKIEIPWRVAGLPGATSDSGPTYDGGTWVRAAERVDKHVAVRLWTPMGKPARVTLDLGDDQHGCTATLTPAIAREAARALDEAADRADAEMAKWRAVLDKQRADILAAVERDMLGRAGEAIE